MDPLYKQYQELLLLIKIYDNKKQMNQDLSLLRNKYSYLKKRRRRLLYNNYFSNN